MLRIGRHLGSGRTSGLPILIGLVALFVLAIASGAQGAVVLRPQSDARNDWHKVGASTAAGALDDEVSAAKRAPKGDYIAAGPDSRVADVRLAPRELKHGKNVEIARLWFAAKTARSSQLTAEVSARGELLGGRTIGAGQRAKWRSFQFKVPNGIALTALHARFESEADSGSQVRAAYARISFKDADDAGAGQDYTEGGASGPSGPVSVYGPSETLRPDAKLPAGVSDSAAISLAQNEYESFQVNLRAGDTGLSGVTVALDGPLTGPDGATISTDDITIYREAYYTVDPAAGKPRSSGAGANGRWPDALIPERDPYYHEDRSAFPYDVAARDQLTAWVDVFAPTDAAAGTYTGSIEVTDANGTIATVPVSAEVMNLEMPSTSSLPSLFLMTPPGRQPCGAHTGDEWCSPNRDESWNFTYLYARAALQNRMTIANPVPGAYEDAPTTEAFNTYLKPMIDGTDTGLAGTVPPLMTGARMTSVTAMWPCINNPKCLAQWHTLADQNGFADRFYAYACDEPSLTPSSAYNFDDWNDCARNSRQARQTWPDVNTLVTSWANGAQQAQSAGKINLDQDVDVLVPNVTELAGTRPAYNSFLSGTGGSGHKQAWVYSSCSSYSCNEDENPESLNYPGYAIDQPASQAEAMGWLSYIYGLQGELYWDTVNSLGTAWSNQYAFGANGDGNLFYPGSVHGTDDAPAIGGTHDIPIESMRLKRIRDGRDDYELLKALTDQGRGAEAMQIARNTFGTQATAAHHTDIPAAQLDGARCALIGLLDPAASTNCATA